MDSYAAKIVGAVIFGVILALLARRKNLNLWLWSGLAIIFWVFLGFAGFVCILVEMVVLAFMPYKCSKCKTPLRGRDEISKMLCPACNPVQASESDGPPAPDQP